MDWTKQSEEILKTWTSAQQSMWDSWIKTLQGVGTANVGENWEKSIETWRDSVKRALEAQTTWTQFWADSVTTGPGATKQAAEWSKQLLDVTKRWTDTQTQLWDNLFETIKKTDPTKVTQSWNIEEIQKVVQTWQDASQKAIEAQLEWARMWATTKAK